MIACPAQAGEPHMIENYIHYVFVLEFNHVGFKKQLNKLSYRLWGTGRGVS